METYDLMEERMPKNNDRSLPPCLLFLSRANTPRIVSIMSEWNTFLKEKPFCENRFMLGRIMQGKTRTKAVFFSVTSAPTKAAHAAVAQEKEESSLGRPPQPSAKKQTTFVVHDR
jgi:hypothetical protein